MSSTNKTPSRAAESLFPNSDIQNYPPSAQTEDGTTAVNNCDGATNSGRNRPANIVGNTDISSRRLSASTVNYAKSSNDQAANLTNSSDYRSSGSSAQAGNSATAFNNRGGGTNSPGNQNSFALPPSGSSAQTENGAKAKEKIERKK